MKKVTKAILFILVPIWISAQPIDTSFNNTISNDGFDQGIALKKKGDWEGALKAWHSAHFELEKLENVDPRIGIAFIELAAKKKAAGYYKTATELYLWGFSKKPPEQLQKILKEEVNRILPMLDEKEREVWQKAVKRNRPDIYQFIQLFWLEKDSRPSTHENERLLEHWQRIIYARENFTKNRNSVYDCDPRGTIYVKYGEADKIYDGILGLSSASKLELVRRVYSPRRRMLIKSIDPNPEYELWRYYNIGTEEPSVFLFANRFGTGSFGLVEGIESLIPREQNLIFQIMYYAELSLYDEFFRERYFKLERIWDDELINPVAKERILGSILKANKGDDKLNPNYQYANIDHSDYEDLFGKIKITTNNIRLLNKDNQPRLAILSHSLPTFKPRKVSARSKETKEIPDYQIKNTLIIRDKTLLEHKRIENVALKGIGNFSIFMVDHLLSNNHYSVTSEAIGSFIDSTDQGELLPGGQKRLHAIGKTFFKGKKPLSNNPNSLEVSDWVLGVNFPSDKYESHMPFPLLPADQVSRSDPLQVYCEIYHLQKDARGSTFYTIEFGITKLDKKGRLDKKAEKVSIVNNFETKEQIRKEHFSVDLSKLKPGLYEFFGKVTDKVSGQEKIRKKKITILE